MSANETEAAKAADLRQRAEEALRKSQADNQQRSSETDLPRLVQELQIHQIELEMQNDELRLARAEVEAGLERYTDLYDFAPVSYFTLNGQGIIGQVNLTGASLLGLERGRLTGRPFARFIAEPDRPIFEACLQQSFDRPEDKVTCEVSLRPPNAPARTVRLDAAVSGADSACRLAVIDITERKAMEAEIRRFNAELEQRVEARTAELAARTAELGDANAALGVTNDELKQALRAKRVFLAMMTHELRTPLTAVLGVAEALQLGVYGPVVERQSHALQNIQRSGRELLALLADILDYSEIEAGKLELQTELLVVGDIAEASVHQVRAPAAKKKLRITCAVDSTARVLHADGRRLTQILVSLLSNAVKFTPPEGEIGLEVNGDAARREMRFAVWDTGIGIKPQDQGLLFQPFVQLDTRLSRDYLGSGLGLALAARLARLHGGSISVESDGVPGHGSRFTVVMPWQTTSSPNHRDRGFGQ